MSISQDESTEQPEFQSHNLIRRSIVGVFNRLSQAIVSVTMLPAKTGDIVLDPYAKINTDLTGQKGINITVPLASYSLILFAGLNRAAALFAFVGFSCARGSSVI